jgi:hypothetical protein
MNPTTTTEARAVADVAAKPIIRRVGSYAFFAWLAFWATMPIYALGRWLDLPRDVISLADTLAMIVMWFALRDMLPHPARALTSQGATASDREPVEREGVQ